MFRLLPIHGENRQKFPWLLKRGIKYPLQGLIGKVLTLNSDSDGDNKQSIDIVVHFG